MPWRSHEFISWDNCRVLFCQRGGGLRVKGRSAAKRHLLKLEVLCVKASLKMCSGWDTATRLRNSLLLCLFAEDLYKIGPVSILSQMAEKPSLRKYWELIFAGRKGVIFFQWYSWPWCRKEQTTNFLPMLIREILIQFSGSHTKQRQVYKRDVLVRKVLEREGGR